MSLKMFWCATAILAIIHLVYPQNISEAQSEILKYETNQTGFSYETSNGIIREENVEVLTKDGASSLSVRGSYSYIGDDGKEYTVTFVADEKGYRPHIEISEPTDAYIAQRIDPKLLGTLVGGGLGR